MPDNEERRTKNQERDADERLKSIMKRARRIELITRGMVKETLGGEYHSRVTGQGTELDDFREYPARDDGGRPHPHGAVPRTVGRRACASDGQVGHRHAVGSVTGLRAGRRVPAVVATRDDQVDLVLAAGAPLDRVQLVADRVSGHPGDRAVPVAVDDLGDGVGGAVCERVVGRGS